MQHCQWQQRKLYLCGERSNASACRYRNQQKRIEEGLKELEIKGKELDGILITHEHADHIQGLGVFSRKYEIPIYGTPGTIRGIRDYKNLGKMPEGLYHEIQVDKEFKLGDIDVHPFAISHDANEPSATALSRMERRSR